MKVRLIGLLLFAPMLAFSQVAQAKGCLKGAAVGGVAGHVAGKHAMVGAAAGCAVGHHAAHKKAKQAHAAQANSNATPAQPAPSGTK